MGERAVNIDCTNNEAFRELCSVSFDTFPGQVTQRNTHTSQVTHRGIHIHLRSQLEEYTYSSGHTWRNTHTAQVTHRGIHIQLRSHIEEYTYSSGHTWRNTHTAQVTSVALMLRGPTCLTPWVDLRCHQYPENGLLAGLGWGFHPKITL